MGVIDGIVGYLNSVYLGLSSSLPPKLFLGISLFLFAILIAISAFIILKFYLTLSKKNFIHLDLRRYNTSEHPSFHKLFAVLFYFIEYILIMPILILLWFVLLSGVLLLLASERAAGQILILSGAVIMAVRLLAYYNEEISKELAKLFPFIALSIFLLTPGAFEITSFLEKLRELPGLLENTVYFFIIIFIFEIVIRVIYTISELFKGHEEVGKEINGD